MIFGSPFIAALAGVHLNATAVVRGPTRKLSICGGAGEASLAGYLVERFGDCDVVRQWDGDCITEFHGELGMWAYYDTSRG